MRRALILLVFVAVILSGCGPVGTSGGDESATRTEDKTGGTVAEGTTKATEVHDPAKAKPGQAIRLTPADPSHKNFRPDPKLAGGN